MTWPATKGGAIVLVLLLAAASSARPAAGKNPICSRANMLEILEKCHIFIKQPRYPIYVASQSSACCEAVRRVRDRNMQCVCILLSRESQRTRSLYSEEKILRLERLCVPPPPPTASADAHRRHVMA